MSLRDLNIRKFRTEDAKAVAKIITNSQMEVTPKAVLTLSNKRKMYVAVDDNRIVGTASIDYDTILGVFVDLQYRNQGVENALVRLLEEIAENNGFKHIKIEAGTDTAKLYEKLGYKAMDEVSSNELGEFTLMEKYLS
ncbi:MAG: acetyltransferase family protein [Clostridia bacterium]|jgi:ribosomal protein S18 acetylase RimI-like enzyme|nr:acetyltransferase family protein [Clostridia bacterium]